MKQLFLTGSLNLMKKLKQVMKSDLEILLKHWAQEISIESLSIQIHGSRTGINSLFDLCSFSKLMTFENTYYYLITADAGMN